MITRCMLSAILPAALLAAMATAQAVAQEVSALDTTQPAGMKVAPDRQPAFDLRERDPDKWQIDIEPAVWFVGLSGNIRLPRSTVGNSPQRDFDDLNLDNPRFEPIAEINVRRGPWRGTLRGAYFESDEHLSGLSGRLGDVTFSAANTLAASLDFTSIELEGAYTVLGRPQVVDDRITFDPRIDVIAGVRVYGEEFSIENLSTGASQSSSEWYIHPQVGSKLNMEFYEDFTIDVQLTVGGLPGNDESYGVDIIAGFQWRPTPHVGMQIGYRALFFGATSGDGSGESRINGTVQGLYGGVTLRF